MVRKLVESAKAPEQFLANAIEAASKQGLQFTAAEAEACLKSNMKPASEGELSDQQLEAVAGGKTDWFSQMCTSNGNSYLGVLATSWT